MDKIKVFLISDDPRIASGVGTQAKYLIEGLLATDRFNFVVFGGAVRHPNYDICNMRSDGSFKIIPVDGYGDKDKLRTVLKKEKPDALLIITDPRFYIWLWEMEDEIRSVCPILYWHVWDNCPTPYFNKVYYESNDFISAISLKTYGILQDMDCKNYNYIPHAVPENIFKPLTEDRCKLFKKNSFGPHSDKKFIVFWNNRNARRKRTGDVIAAFSKFATKVGKNNVALAMHTQVGDPEGQNILEVAKCFGVDGNMIINEERLTSEVLNEFYNACDTTINIANAEGFGLSTLESLMSGSPIIVNMTGGLQFQIGDWWEGFKNFSNQDKLTLEAKKKYTSGIGKWFGVPVFPASRVCTGSQQIPYIYDDFVSHDDVVKALIKLYDMGRERRRAIGLSASEWARKNFNMNNMIKSWFDVLISVSEKYKKEGHKQYRIIKV